MSLSSDVTDPILTVLLIHELKKNRPVKKSSQKLKKFCDAQLQLIISVVCT
jgi:hypothetical protein